MEKNLQPSGLPIVYKVGFISSLEILAKIKVEFVSGGFTMF